MAWDLQMNMEGLGGDEKNKNTVWEKHFLFFNKNGYNYTNKHNNKNPKTETQALELNSVMLV